jgi:hypothetical protein
MKMVLKNSRRIGLLKSDLRAIIREGTLDISKKVLEGDSDHEEEPESHTEMKCNPPSHSPFGASLGRCPYITAAE